ncbi:unnamed protein product [Dicrocoelium dendriticum]|nr:unnamed protein product [Dicrocoelium dendriticum]
MCNLRSTVPSNTIMNGENFEFRVTFRKSLIMRWRRSKPKATIICQKLKNISEGMIESCTEVTIYGDYGFADVLFVPTTTSVWEAQMSLMIQLNSKNKRRCNFNVAVKPITKEFRVTFRKSEIMSWRGSKPKTTLICQKLKNISEGLIETCTDVTMHGDYGFADILFVPTTASVWEAQMRLMIQLNSRIITRCNFNVAVKPISKGY